MKWSLWYNTLVLFDYYRRIKCNEAKYPENVIIIQDCRLASEFYTGN